LSDNTVYCKEKRAQIEHLIEKGDADLATVRALALSEGGLLCNKYRQHLWLKCLGLPRKGQELETDITDFQDYTQVLLDVHRCHSRLPKDIKNKRVRSIKRDLSRVICNSLALQYLDKGSDQTTDTADRHYYQGYHDVSLTLYYVLGERNATRAMSVLCERHVSSHIRTNLDETSEQMRLIIPLVSQRCPELADFILLSDAGTMFSLSWIITWFAYVLNDEAVIARLYDVFISSPPLMPVYMSAAVVLYRRREILEVECELSAVHKVLHTIPQDLPFELLIREANDLLEEYPPELVKTLPIKGIHIILQVPRYGYLDWSKNWAMKFVEACGGAGNLAMGTSLLVGLAAFAISAYSGRGLM